MMTGKRSLGDSEPSGGAKKRVLLSAPEEPPTANGVDSDLEVRLPLPFGRLGNADRHFWPRQDFRKEAIWRQMQEYKRQLERVRDREVELSKELSQCKETAKAIETYWNVVRIFICRKLSVAILRCLWKSSSTTFA
jgi:hypothetical protein